MTTRSQISLALVSALCAFTASATAEPYWIAYEGNDFPENEGWWRVYSGGGAERWIEDGMLVLDGLADLGINDVYGYDQYPIDPGPGEMFVAEWRFAIDEIISGPDPGFGLFSDESWAVGFSFSDDLIRSGFEQETFDFNFTGFHTFRLTSSDMRNYTLEADGEVIHEGVFHHVFSASQLRWGDSIEGGASLTRWDYMRFGVIPEPSAVWLVIAGLAACVLRTVRRGMRRVVLLPVLACLLAASATAEPYWIAYEGNDFPENEGWSRGYSGGGAERWIEDGMLVLDGLADLGINDYYTYGQYPIDPGPGELFVAEWRFAIDEIISGPDPEVAVFSDESWGVGLAFSDDHIRTAYDHEVVPFDFVGFHTFRLTSYDMRNYRLEADGEVIHEGVFHHVFSASSLVWGDGIEGGASLTRWDYMRFGVIPEPSAVWLVIAGLAACVLRTVRSGMRRVVLLPVLACVLAASATAAPYWIAYEGNDFPENEGWWRVYSGGGAERWIEDGMLVLDGLADLEINDLYGYNQYPIDPGPGELFVAEFRFAIDEIVSGPDPGIALFSDDSWAVALSFSDDSIRSELENETFDFDFVGFHTFRLTSSDMRNYTLEADGQVIREGVFDQVISTSQLRWGDAIEGGASLTRWDHMRFGVVPEPRSIILGFITTLTLAIRQRR